MRGLLVLFVVVVLAGSVAADDWHGTFDFTVTAADTVDNRDTIATRVWNLTEKPWVNVWFAIQAAGVDTIFQADTLYYMGYTGLTPNGPWALFDSTKFILNGNPDTTSYRTKRYDSDSVAVTGNFFYAKFVNGVTLAGGDTLSVGRDCGFNVQLHLIGKY